MFRLVGYYGTMWVSADFIEQKVVCKKKEYNPYKAVRSVAVGAGVVAPLVYNWMKISEAIFPGKSIRIVMTKVFIDAFVFGPIAISSFYLSSSMLQGKGVQGSIDEWKQKIVPTVKRAWCLWPGVQVVNFMFVPPAKRAYVVGTVSFFWSVFLCYMKDDSIKHEET